MYHMPTVYKDTMLPCHHNFAVKHSLLLPIKPCSTMKTLPNHENPAHEKGVNFCVNMPLVFGCNRRFSLGPNHKKMYVK